MLENFNILNYDFFKIKFINLLKLGCKVKGNTEFELDASVQLL